MRLAPGRDVGLGSQLIGLLGSVLVPVSRIGQYCLWRGLGIADSFLDHRAEVPVVRRLVGRSLSNNDLMGLVDEKLAVVSLQKFAPFLHDPAVRIGKVSLCLRLWSPVGFSPWAML